MRKYFFIFLSAMSTLSAEPTLHLPQSSLIETSVGIGEADEVSVVDQLIVTTSQQLEMEKHLKRLMLDFKAQKEEFVQGNQTKSHAGRMVRTARQIYELISAHHLQHLFSKDYLDELTFFSSIAGKNAIKRP